MRSSCCWTLRIGLARQYRELKRTFALMVKWTSRRYDVIKYESSDTKQRRVPGVDPRVSVQILKEPIGFREILIAFLTNFPTGIDGDNIEKEFYEIFRQSRLVYEAPCITSVLDEICDDQRKDGIFSLSKDSWDYCVKNKDIFDSILPRLTEGRTEPVTKSPFKVRVTGDCKVITEVCQHRKITPVCLWVDSLMEPL